MCAPTAATAAVPWTAERRLDKEHASNADAAMLFFLKSLVAMFTIVDPIGLVRVVLSLTANLPSLQRKQVVTRAVVIAGIVLCVFGVAGQLIFSSLEITSEAFSLWALQLRLAANPYCMLHRFVGVA